MKKINAIQALKGKILVTGSAGFMGSHLFDALHAEGCDVHGVDDLSGGYLHNITDHERFTQLDLRDREQTARYVEHLKPSIIFHLAADATEGRSQFTPFSALDRNLTAYMNLLVPAIRCGVKQIILTSSMSVYGAQQVPFTEDFLTIPEDIYGISKASMESVTKVLSQVFGFRYLIIRPHNVFGPRQNIADPYRNVIGIFINRLLHNKPFYIYGDGKQKRAFTYIDDVIPPMIKAAKTYSCYGQILNIGGDIPVTVNQLSKMVLEEYFETKNIPKAFKPAYLPARPQEVKYAFCSHAMAEKLLGYKAETSLRDGIREMVIWAKKMGPQTFMYLEQLDLENKRVPATWKKKLL